MVVDSSKIYSFSYRDLHVAKLASVAEAAPLLPEGADSLAADCCLAVSKRATVTLQKQETLMTLSIHSNVSKQAQSAHFSAGGIIKEVAVISTVAHGNRGTG